MSLKERFASYVVFDPGVDRPLHEVSRTEAEEHFEHHIASIEPRLAELQKLVGPEIALDFSDRSLEQLGTWYPRVVTGFCAGDDWPMPEAFSIANDLGMYLGQTLCHRAPSLGWRLELTNKRNAAYQRPVIAGFRKVSDPKGYHIDYDDVLCGYAVWLTQGGDPNEGRMKILVNSQLEFV